MKKFLTYVTVMVGMLFVGLTSYYFIRNNENIKVTIAEGNEYYMNVGDELDYSDIIIHERKHKDTVVTIYSANEQAIINDDENEKLIAVGGGISLITVDSNNPDFPAHIFTIIVGDGTMQNPWYISSADDLRAIGTGPRKLSDSYRVINDIILNENWVPIGVNMNTEGEQQADNIFTGTLDGKIASGDFSTIKNLTILGDYTNAGLFAQIGVGGTVENLIFSGVLIQGEFETVGTIAGINRGFIGKVEVKTEYYADSSVGSLDVGGIVSYSHGASVGGIVGVNRLDNTIDVPRKGYIGMVGFTGVVGQYIAIDSGAPMKGAYIGGLAGKNLGGTVFNCYSLITTMNEKTDSYVGGLIGYVSKDNMKETIGGSPVQFDVFPIVKNNFAVISGEIVAAGRTGAFGYRGGVGEGISSNEADVNRICGNYFASEEAGTFTSYNGVTKVSSKNDLIGLENIDRFISIGSEKWDIGIYGDDTVWIIESTYPQLNFTASQQVLNIDLDEISIGTAETLLEYTEKINSSSFWASKNYRLTNDIKLGTAAAYYEWDPIGSDKIPFLGKFFGDGFKISNIQITTSDKYATGFFSCTNGSTTLIADLNLEGVLITTGNFSGGIAGFHGGGVISNCSVSDVRISNGLISGLVVGYNVAKITATINSDDYVKPMVTIDIASETAENKITVSNITNVIDLGGIVGYNYAGAIIENAKIDGNITITGASGKSNSTGIKYIGGIVGYNQGTLKGCSINFGLLEDKSVKSVYVGGVAGANGVNGSITECHAGGAQFSLKIELDTTKAVKDAGGIAAVNLKGGVVTKSFANVDITAYYAGGIIAVNKGEVSECYAKGSILAEAAGGMTVINAGEITNCYTLISLKGINEKTSILAGLSTYLPAPGYFEYCFVSVGYSNSNKCYPETASMVKEDIINFVKELFGSSNQLGYIYNIVVDETLATSKITQTKGLSNLWGLWKPGRGGEVRYISTFEAITAFDIFRELGFSTGTWLYTTGKYPELANAFLDGITQNDINQEFFGEGTEDPENPEIPEDPEGTE